MHREEYPVRRIPRKGPRALVVRGQGVRIRVRGHRLEITDGFPLESPQETRAVSRAASSVHRLLLLAGSGFVTVDALDWLAENEIAAAATDQRGRLRWVLLPGGRGMGQARLRRAQALAPFTDTGLHLARDLIGSKLHEQRRVLEELARRLAWPGKDSVGPACRVLDECRELAERAETLPGLARLEARAADAYWSAWIGLPLRFGPPSYARRVPPWWRAYRGRGTGLDGPREATEPANALLNYAYALLETEAALALQEAGLDPALGLLHSDQDGRASLVYDVMEPARPTADRLVLSFVLSHVFRPGELHLLRDGRCRLDQDLCARLWPWMPTFRAALGPVILRVLQALRDGPHLSERRAYRLVEVPAPVRTRAPLGQKRWASRAPEVRIRPRELVCRACGQVLENVPPDRTYCDDCLPGQKLRIALLTLRQAHERTRALRREGRDPAASPATRQRLREARLARLRDIRAWEAAHPERPEASDFVRRIRPLLETVPVRQLARALGLSVSYAGAIRSGQKTPHPRHWERIAETVRGLLGRGGEDAMPRE
jgi:CRISPR-associated endonuclease Cas1